MVVFHKEDTLTDYDYDDDIWTWNPMNEFIMVVGFGL